MSEENRESTLSTKTQIDALCSSAVQIDIAAVQRLVDKLNRMETVLPIIDPTEYRRLMRTMPNHKRVAEAFLRFRKEIEQILESEKGRNL